MLVAITLLLASPAAHAGRCDALVKRADRLSAAELPAGFQAVIDCDVDEALAAFPRFMTRANDSDALVALSLTAIDGQVWNPVWAMPGKISDYSVRDIITGQIGEACTSHPAVVQFLEGAYGALRGLDFQQWDDAFIACRSPDLDAWMDERIADPPQVTYDEKYDQLMAILVARRGRDALEPLKAAAIAAADGGPFDSILMRMEEAVAPPLGAEMDPQDKAALEAALVDIAQQVGPEQARAVADRLAAAGAEDQAARLLPVVFPDRHDNGVFTWGGVSIERAECKGVKTAVLHVAEITEPGKRWIVNDEVIEPLRSVKPRLKKCTPEPGDWEVVTTPEPVARGEVDDWARKLAGQWMSRGYEVEIRNEPDIVLP
ncbi:MAG: hypothetical protein D6798_06690 [Deltaproteobacteria bacterium]|nr:MAG: hypothetical protein D6798_06690 [Deltaproteobacteria bacterium]